MISWIVFFRNYKKYQKRSNNNKQQLINENKIFQKKQLKNYMQT